jgi:predicted GIY-YIG superfamily endonuclease
MIYTEFFENLSDARKRECEIKKLTRKEKEKLIEKSIN